MRCVLNNRLEFGSQIQAGDAALWVTRTQIRFKLILQDFVPVSCSPHLSANSMRAGSASFSSLSGLTQTQTLY